MFKLVGHFRVPKTLTFKIRPSAQPFLWKWDLFAWEWKIISIRHWWCTLFAPQNLHNLCFSFLLGITAPQEKLKTMLMQHFFSGGGGGKKGALWEMCKWRKAEHLTSLWYRGPGELENGLWPMSWGLFLKSPVNFSSPESCFVFAAFASRIKVSAILKIILVIAIAMYERAKILPICARCLICLEMSWITVIYEK